MSQLAIDKRIGRVIGRKEAEKKEKVRVYKGSCG